MLPNLLIIGAAKAGTTSMHHYLGAHPEIFMSRPKELLYFHRDDWRERRAWYEQHFDAARGERYRGESTPHYTTHPYLPRTAERVHELVPDARLIYMVRDPIDRLVAAYLEERAFTVYRRGHGGLRKPERTWEGFLANWREDHWVWASRYATQVQVYLDHFPADRLLVVDQHELRGDRAGVLRRVFDWLGVDAGFESPAFAEEHNTSSRKTYPRLPPGVWSRVVEPLADRVPPHRRGAIARPLKRLLTRELEEPRPVVEGELREQMREVLQPEVDWLRDFTGQRFASWSL